MGTDKFQFDEETTMYAQAVRKPPVPRRGWANNQVRLNMFKGCAFSDVGLDCIKYLKLGDPAAGSGNFLTETCLALRRIENEVISAKQHGQITLGAVMNPIRVSIEQFYGIEINDFAATVAKTALWIAESQMMKATEDPVGGVRHHLLRGVRVASPGAIRRVSVVGNELCTANRAGVLLFFNPVIQQAFLHPLKQL